MFNFYAFDKKRTKAQNSQHEDLKLAQLKDRMKLTREKLYENYTKRISDFILHMEKQPIKINTYTTPIENVGRVTDPAKFKGKAHIVVREYKTHRERLLESLKFTSIHSPSPNYQKPVVLNLKESKSVKIMPKRMYFKPKNNLERVMDELKSRHVDITELEGTKKKKIQGFNKFNPRKTWVALPNVVSDGQNLGKESDEEHSEEIEPKQIFAGLHNKTYFKGVTSFLINSDNKTRGQLDQCAEEVLQNCNVKPKSNENFLRIGSGKLVSNPEESIKSTYLMLRRTINNL